MYNAIYASVLKFSVVIASVGVPHNPATDVQDGR